MLGLVHSALRVHMGIIGNDGADRFNENGISLFDAAVRWLLKLPDEPPEFNVPVVVKWNGDAILDWRGNSRRGSFRYRALVRLRKSGESSDS